jgi:cytoskeletal protein CcmA (bactofilin family)
MIKTIRVIPLLLLFVLALFPSSEAFAQGTGPGDGKVIFGTNFTLESGDTFEGDLVVFGGNVTIEDEALLKGNLVVFGGTVTSDGKVDGDLVIIGGLVSLKKHAVITGDVVTIGGQLDRANEARIEGEVVNNAQPNFDIPNGRLPVTSDVPNRAVDFGFNLISGIFQTIFRAVAAAAFAMLLALFWKPQLDRAGYAVVSQPLIIGAIGLASLVLGFVLVLTVVPTIIVGFAFLFGTVALGSEVGERFTKAINQSWPPVLTAGFGTFLLVLVSGAFGYVPCLGGLAQFLLSLLGIGAAIVTWFGIRTGHTLIKPQSP